MHRETVGSSSADHVHHPPPHQHHHDQHPVEKTGQKEWLIVKNKQTTVFIYIYTKKMEVINFCQLIFIFLFMVLYIVLIYNNFNNQCLSLILIELVRNVILL